MSQSNLFPLPPRPPRKPKGAHEWKIVSLRETASDELPCCVKPDDAVQYWRKHIATAPHFNPDCECFAVLMLNVRQRIRGHHLVSIGSLTEAMAHPREVFRAAVIGAAHSVILMHNHPSGDPSPSDADLRMTRRLVESGRILCIEVADHIVVGSNRHLSLRETGTL
jgi:DNA repair protein RadC